LTIELIRIDTGNAILLKSVAADVFDESIDPERLAAYLANPANLLILAVANGLVIGMVMGVIHKHPDKPNELYVDEVGVTPDRRRHGVARQLMDAMIKWGEELECEDAWLGTDTDNVGACALYKHYAKGEEVILYEWELESS
jgi:ribosomal protein S18 acetylase RimI-like enzyme